MKELLGREKYYYTEKQISALFKSQRVTVQIFVKNC